MAARSSLLRMGITHKVHWLFACYVGRRNRPGPPTGGIHDSPGLLGARSHQGDAACQPAQNTEGRLKREIDECPYGASEPCTDLPERTVRPADSDAAQLWLLYPIRSMAIPNATICLITSLLLLIVSSPYALM